MATYKCKDQFWQSESTTYWFEIDGETYGVVESGPDIRIVDCDWDPVNTGDRKNAHLRPLIQLVTDEMRQS